MSSLVGRCTTGVAGRVALSLKLGSSNVLWRDIDTDKASASSETTRSSDADMRCVSMVLRKSERKRRWDDLRKISANTLVVSSGEG